MEENRWLHWLLALGALTLSIPAWTADAPWTAFSHEDMIGFKDARGKVRVEPNLMPGFTNAQRFDRIIATGNYTAGSSYYLLRDGRRVMPGSVYSFDSIPDCESEGSIRFRDHEHNTVGFLDGNGRVLIPAEMNEVTPLHNGMAVALKGATRECAEPSVSLEQCEVTLWKGGTTSLIDSQGVTLVKNLHDTRLDNLDWFSIEVSTQPSTEPSRIAFKGEKGRYYSFVDIEKDFAAWFKNEFLTHLDDTTLKANSYKEVWHDQGSEEHGPSEAMITQFGPALRVRLEVLRASSNYGVAIANMGNPLEVERAPQFFDNCGQFTQWKTPLVSAVEHWEQGSFKSGKHAVFNFIRTAEGYRLLSFSIPKAN
ncbi:WG repeat-containing protein [Pseudomonas fluorescens]|uniref:Uncharacterized protein n=1 Tax=Pseudomonas fluorescens TaxID=294 RepID=A0A5E7QK16_PSEFL|nr:WG repeat-containing protein [Pseudomonas fluorescens]VVP61227.1 hypothetical protein PS880_06278 [Pseudomonas fluorescens]